MTHSLALIHTQFGPYHLARLRSLRAHYPGPVYAIQLADQEALRDWTVDADADLITVATGTLESLSPRAIAQSLVQQLDRLRPDALVIAGYHHPAMRAAFTWARRQGARTVLLSDSQGRDRPRNPLVEALKGAWLRRHCDAALVAGSRAAAYVEQLGLPSDRLWRGYDVVDNGQFSTPLPLPEVNPHFLYVGRLSPEKNLRRFLQAYDRYRQQAGAIAWDLVMVGSGPQEAELQTLAQQLDLTVHWAGFQQLADLPAYYQAAAALVLPSLSEPWGLVVNEAMAAGLPILASTQCGCVPDLVFPGINGALFSPWDVGQLADVLLRFSQRSPSQRQQMGQASQRLIAHYTPDHWAIALSDCVLFVLGDRRPERL
ncbi:glycosyltransferase family 4 protein [Leptolyngbya sp. CCY15150]|uniref:glycosyltransferase family 4 protein n=1 Tax=Leptolyngbya sp. CCY15150 TaxID=2767772 RepID=UPI00194F27D6|nr:glycosyltransferase family 4 protein [Leptolyngbya sp. CCY15150]